MTPLGAASDGSPTTPPSGPPPATRAAQRSVLRADARRRRTRSRSMSTHRRRSLVAVIGLVTVLLGITGFSIWSAASTARSSERATDATRLADTFARATQAAAAEESIEREYRLEPGPIPRSEFADAARTLVAALDEARPMLGPDDVTQLNRVIALHRAFVRQMGVLFAAVDADERAEVARIDTDEGEPLFAAIEEYVGSTARGQHDVAMDTLASLREHQVFIARATPGMFALGLVLTGVFGSELRRVRRELESERQAALHAAMHDALTGLPNRSLLADRLDQLLRAGRRFSTITGLLVLDLDRFKEVNDALGHRYGDALLIQVASRLSDHLREVDTVGRLGGDEFAVLLPDVSGVDGVLNVAEKLRSSLTTPFRVDGIEVEVEASFGAAVSEAADRDSAGLLQRADVAMYVAKDRGLGVFAYDRTRDVHAPERLALLAELRRALERQELVLHYQPKVSLTTGLPCGAEALVRWEHPMRGMIPPDTFIPLAERTGLIGPLTGYVLDRALAQSRAWADTGRAVPLAVNISARNLLDPILVDQVESLLTRYRIPAGMLQLEVTESAMMTEPVRARTVLQRLRALGVHLAIDDFGAGYTSLAQLKTLPLSELKIDQSFVTTMDTDPSNATIVQSVIELGHNLGLTAVAEGVETESTLRALARYGCDVAQGYYLSRPLPADTFIAWYARERARPAHPVPPQLLPAQLLPAHLVPRQPGPTEPLATS